MLSKKSQSSWDILKIGLNARQYMVNANEWERVEIIMFKAGLGEQVSWMIRSSTDFKEWIKIQVGWQIWMNDKGGIQAWFSELDLACSKGS